jgi:hypothetical protein
MVQKTSTAAKPCWMRLCGEQKVAAGMAAQFIAAPAGHPGRSATGRHQVLPHRAAPDDDVGAGGHAGHQRQLALQFAVTALDGDLDAIAALATWIVFVGTVSALISVTTPSMAP